MDSFDVVIVGAGFSGTMVAVHLLSAGAGPPLRVALIERGEAFARGVAYGTPSALHLLNVPAGRMGAFPDRPEHFLSWVQEHPEEARSLGVEEVAAGSFLPRKLYGRYLAAVLAEAAGGADSRFQRIRGEVSDAEPLADGSSLVHFAEDRPPLRTALVVLALGNFPPGDPPLRDRRFHGSPRYLQTPWSAETHALLAAPGDVLILGSGLTALDLLLTLREQKREGRIHVISRRGLFPQPHRAVPAHPATPAFDADAMPKSALGLLRCVRAEIRRCEAQGGDWRAVIDALRPVTQPLWRALDLRERRRFLRHLRAWWEAHRHRAAPAVLEVREELEKADRLVCHRGRVASIEPDGEALEVRFTSRGYREGLRVGYVVNCTGPECNYHKLKDPLVVQLFARGLIRPDPLLLGLDTDEDGGLLNYLGESPRRVFTLGSPRKGLLFETTAVPELRAQAHDLAAVLRRELRKCRAPRLSDLVPDAFYAFEI
jgi:uncharacterized NAD(P)/FAD-binding protein YdhS